jgi:hypothetical protein
MSPRRSWRKADLNAPAPQCFRSLRAFEAGRRRIFVGEEST